MKTIVSAFMGLVLLFVCSLATAQTNNKQAVMNEETVGWPNKSPSTAAAPSASVSASPVTKAKVTDQRASGPWSDEVAFTRALNLMALNGYEGIADLRRQEDMIYATAIHTKSGRTIKISVDLHSGVVKELK